ncbi:MAG: hypothetical protein ACRDQA_10080 [Nocardioidaceae bacterium]
MSEKSPVLRAVGNQRRAVVLAACLAVAAIWVAFGLGNWVIGVFVAAGIVLGLANHIGTELTLLKAVEYGEQVDRKQYAMSSLVRLMVVSVVAVGLAVAFWPDGATVLFGLAIFHLIALVLTGIPLLKEVRKA